MTEKISVSLDNLIDPRSNYWSNEGQVPLSGLLFEQIKLAWFASSGIKLDASELFDLHLALLAQVAEVPANVALDVWLVNPYWQYFCGGEYFQTTVTESRRRAFSRFHSKIKKSAYWTLSKLKPIVESLPAHEPRAPSGPSVLLRDIVAPDNQLVLALELFRPAEIEKLGSQGFSRGALTLGLLADAQNWTDWRQSRAPVQDQSLLAVFLRDEAVFE